MNQPVTRPKPPLWLLLATIASVPLWLLFGYWLNNSYSGWNSLAAVYPAGERELTNSVGPTGVTIVQPSGRRYEFITRRGYKQAVAGFDAEGFWIRAKGRGWFEGPGTPVFIPWDAVAHCDVLRIQIRYPSFGLIIHDQKILDACALYVGRKAPSPCPQ